METTSKPKVDMVGHDGNAFAILGRCSRAARKAGMPKELYAEFQKKAMSGDYNNLVATVMEYFDCDGGDDE